MRHLAWLRVAAAVILTVAIGGTIAVLATGAGDPDDLPILLYTTFVFVGLAIGATVALHIGWALVSIVREPGVGGGKKAGWVLLCLALPVSGAGMWFSRQRRLKG